MRLTVFRFVLSVFLATATVMGFIFIPHADKAEAAPANQMTLVFETTQMYETLALTFGGELSNVVINWGDLDSDPSTQDVIQNVNNQPAGSGDVTFQQSPDFGGTYQVTITATKLERFGRCVNGSDTTLKRVTTWGNFGLTSLRCAFNYRSELREVPTTLPSTVTDLSYAFAYANAFNQDISGWDTTNVTNMQSMFENAVSFNRSLATWNISNVTNMTDIFKKLSYYSMSNDNYSATLASWGAQSVRPNVSTGAISMQAVTCAGIQGRAALLASPHNWTISDVAPTLDCGQNNNQNNNQNSNNTNTASSISQLAETGTVQNALAGLALMMLSAGAIILGFTRKQGGSFSKH
jgi:surface protein